MTLRGYKRASHQGGTWFIGLLILAASGWAGAQVFVVGEKTATSEVKTDFTPTSVQLPDGKLTERGRRELIRDLDAEQGFAHLPLPMGPGLTLRANGPLTPGPEQYRKMVYQKGQAAAPGDRVIITAMVIKPDRIIFDFNGGPYAKHRFLSHVQFNDANVVADPNQEPTGARITLLFEGQLPEISAPEIKSLLAPLVDFGAKSSEQAYAETLPTPIKDAVAAHEVLVGMTHRMVLAAMGGPDSKIREQDSGDPNGARYEEWIYGKVPQTVRFVRFVGDRVVTVEIAAMGKPMEIHDKDEMAGYNPNGGEHEVAMGDSKPRASGEDDGKAAPAPPTLAKPGEAIGVTNAGGRVQFPDDPKSDDDKAPTLKRNPSSNPDDPKPDAAPAATAGDPDAKAPDAPRSGPPTLGPSQLR